MTKIIPGWVKNEDGTSSKAPETKKVTLEPIPVEPEESIDALLNKGLIGIGHAIRTLRGMITSGNVSREVIGSLKDCMTMLHDLKKKEKELLDTLSDEQLEKLLKESK